MNFFSSTWISSIFFSFQYFNKNSGKLLYVSGEVVSSNIHEQLIDLDYQVDRIINYSAQHIKEFDHKFIQDLKQNIPEICLLYTSDAADE